MVEWIENLCKNKLVYNGIVFLIMLCTFFCIVTPSCPKLKTYWIVLLTIGALSYKIPCAIYELPILNMILDFVYPLVIIILLKGNFVIGLVVMLCLFILQPTLSFLYGITMSGNKDYNASIYILSNLDLLILIYAIQKELKWKGGEKKWEVGDACFGGALRRGFFQLRDSFLGLLSFLTTSLKGLFLKRKKDTRKANLLNIIVSKQLEIVFTILYVAWNFFTFYLVYLLAKSGDRVLEMGIVVAIFIASKKAFGKPLHLTAELCFVVSMIVFYVISKSLPSSSTSLLVLIMVGLFLSMISSLVCEVIYSSRAMSIRQRVLQIVGDDPTQDTIKAICKSKGFTDEKAEETSFTIITYLNNSLYKSAELVDVDNRTILRRINYFLDN